MINSEPPKAWLELPTSHLSPINIYYMLCSIVKVSHQTRVMRTPSLQFTLSLQDYGDLVAISFVDGHRLLFTCHIAIKLQPFCDGIFFLMFTVLDVLTDMQLIQVVYLNIHLKGTLGLTTDGYIGVVY